METQKRYRYKPKDAVPPGESLKELLEHQKISPGMLSILTGMHVKVIVGIFAGRVEISEDIAGKLERGTNVPASMWMNLEHNYRALLRGMDDGK